MILFAPLSLFCSKLWIKIFFSPFLELIFSHLFRIEKKRKLIKNEKDFCFFFKRHQINPLVKNGFRKPKVLKQTIFLKKSAFRKKEKDLFFEQISRKCFLKKN
mmetsp:Transcript_8086/g.16126  ORF Transcript_8086/g.16126 Transcript_8086/m.16126 type:complete len:103 (-) Transcript_8086:266-574(-)